MTNDLHRLLPGSEPLRHCAMKFCETCQTDTELDAHGRCDVCEKAKKKAYNKAHYEANRDTIKANSAAWRASNSDRVKARDAAYRAANRGKAKENAASWRVANPGRAKTTSAAWTKANPEARRIQYQNRRARKRESGGVLSRGLSAKLFKLQRGKCACCGHPLGKNYHLDHVMPLALGGLNVDGNMQLLRQQCNNKKSAKHPVDFMQERGFLL